MIGRIRQVECLDVLCYYKGNRSVSIPLYTYDDILSYLRHCETLNGRKMLKEVVYERIESDDFIEFVRKEVKMSLFDQINIHNEVEYLNKCSGAFLTVLNKLIQQKGHAMRFENAPPKKGKTIVNDDMWDKIAEIDETKFDIADLLTRQRQSKLFAEEKLVLKKYYFKKFYGIVNTSNVREFLKFHKVYETLLGPQKELENFLGLSKRPQIYIIDDEHINLLTNGLIPPDEPYLAAAAVAEPHSDKFYAMYAEKREARKKIVVDFINRITGRNQGGFTFGDLREFRIDNGTYQKIMVDIANNSEYFKNEKKNRALFSKKKSETIKYSSEHNKHFFQIIKTILRQYGLEFMREEGTRTRKKGDDRHTYIFKINYSINKSLLYKYFDVSEMPGYLTLFNCSNF